MAWDTDRKQRQSDLARNDATNRTCPSCGRGGALVGRSLPDRYVTYCKWWPQGKCDYNVIDFWKVPGD